MVFGGSAANRGKSAVTLWYQVAPRSSASFVVVSVAFTLGFAFGIQTVVYLIFLPPNLTCGAWNLTLCAFHRINIELIKPVQILAWYRCVGVGFQLQCASIYFSPHLKDNDTASRVLFCFLTLRKQHSGLPKFILRSAWQTGKFPHLHCKGGRSCQNLKQTKSPELEVTGGTMMMNEQKGVKRQAAFEHLEFCNRSVRKSALKYPWDSVLQYNPHSCFDLVRPSGATPLVLNNIGSDNQQVDLPRAPVSLCKKFFTKQPRIDWEVKLNAMRESAIVKWQKIVGEGPMFFEVSRYFFLSIRDGHETGTLFDCLKTVFASKSTSTLNNRVGPLLRYVFHCKTTSKESFPLVEAQVYEYMLYEEAKVGGAPTYLRSFISSLAFCHYVLGLQGAKCIVESKRITGLATKMYLTKRKTESRLPFMVCELKFLEDVLFGKYNRSWADRHFVGCILFMVFARASCEIQWYDECLRSYYRSLRIGWQEGRFRWSKGHSIKNFLQHGPQGQAATNVCNYQGRNR